jgi:hypothetical protein
MRDTHSLQFIARDNTVERANEKSLDDGHAAAQEYLGQHNHGPWGSR